MDAYWKLGVSKTANDQQIKRAYIDALREVSLEHDPARFEEIRAAYELIKDASKRAEYELFHIPEIELSDILKKIIPSPEAQKPSVDWLISMLKKNETTAN